MHHPSILPFASLGAALLLASPASAQTPAQPAGQPAPVVVQVPAAPPPGAYPPSAYPPGAYPAPPPGAYPPGYSPPPGGYYVPPPQMYYAPAQPVYVGPRMERRSTGAMVGGIVALSLGGAALLIGAVAATFSADCGGFTTCSSTSGTAI